MLGLKTPVTFISIHAEIQNSFTDWKGGTLLSEQCNTCVYNLGESFESTLLIKIFGRRPLLFECEVLSSLSPNDKNNNSDASIDVFRHRTGRKDLQRTFSIKKIFMKKDC